MKKIILFISSILLTLISFSWEVQIKGGYDIYRYGTISGGTKGQFDNGFILNVEYIPFNRGVFEIGIGGEYNFGNATWYYKTLNDKKGYSSPIYLLGKINYVRTYNNKMAVYSFTRLGYVVASDDVESNSYDGGLYYGVGLGFEIDNFVMEGLYDGKYSKKSKTHKLGLRTGLRFGTYEKCLPNIEVNSMEYFINYVPPKQEIISY
ncbi:hypothetical protein [Caviibacter abscessus]|uniref:hypothetical protein n=1 Tax=Caviibacter abscessus TaxID=1766719 RepID=UPI00082E588D|nr:hypothetical protein [Caviibacter abscessus]